MNDEFLRRRMHSLESADEPRPEFVAGLHDDLAGRLGLPVERQGAAVIARRRSSSWLLIAATIALLLALVVGLAATGALPNLLPFQVPVLRQIQVDGALRIAITPDLPQAMSPSGSLQGFDVDVAEAVATRLGVRAERVIVPQDEVLGADPDWQVGLLGLPPGHDPRDPFTVSTPYYSWPTYVVVNEADAATRLADLESQAICTVEGTTGEVWLNSSTNAAIMRTAEPPSGVRIRLMATEDACVESVESGESRAYMSSSRLLADFASTGALRVLGDAPVALEWRSMIVPSSLPGADQFTSELNRLIEEMRGDGSLSEMSRRWFGGEDLTN